MSNAGRGKPNRVPGMRNMPNGDAPPEIPPDIEWDEDDPPFIHSCSRHVEHAGFCDGSCEGEYATESMVNLINEHLAWQRLGMVPMGVPMAMRGAPINGLLVEIWDLETRYMVLQDWVEEQGITEEELNERFRIKKFERMQTVRKQNEETLRKRQIADKFGIVEKQVLGPDGNPIG